MVRKFLDSYGLAIICVVVAVIYVSVAEAARPTGGKGGGKTPLSCTITPDPVTATTGEPVVVIAETQRGKGGKNYLWDFSSGTGTSSSTTTNPIDVTYASSGSFSVSLTVTDRSGSDTCTTDITIVEGGGGDGGGSTKSINSTSQNGRPADVAEPPLLGSSSYRIFGTNDLGMHCGDFDTRVSSILPPFNVLHAQVIQCSAEPRILTRDDGIGVVYSAASNPDDPILSGINSAGSAILANGPNPGVTPATFPVLSSVANNGTVFKTNFWDIVLEAYGPFYPPGILDAFAHSRIRDCRCQMSNSSGWVTVC